MLPVKYKREVGSIFSSSPAAAEFLRYSGRGGSNRNPKFSCPKVVYSHGGSCSKASPPAASVVQRDSGCGGQDHVKTVRSWKASIDGGGQVGRDGVGKDVIKLQEENCEPRERVSRKENSKTDVE